MQVVCGQCRHVFRLDPERVGEAMSCPQCRQRIRLCDVPRDAPPLSDEPAGPAEAGQDERDFAELARKGIARRIAVVCGGCGNRMMLSLRRSGQAVRCSACGKKVQVPDLDAEPAAQGEQTAMLETDHDQGRLDLATAPAAAGGQTAPEPEGQAPSTPARPPGRDSRLAPGLAVSTGDGGSRPAQRGAAGRLGARPRAARHRRRWPLAGLVAGALAAAALAALLWAVLHATSKVPPPASPPASGPAVPARADPPATPRG